MRLLPWMHRKAAVAKLAAQACRDELLWVIGHRLFPEQIDNPDGLSNLVAHAAAAPASSPHVPLCGHPIELPTFQMPEQALSPMLTDAIAVIRLEWTHSSCDTVGPQWCRGVAVGMRGWIEIRNAKWCSPVACGAPALEALFSALIHPQHKRGQMACQGPMDGSHDALDCHQVTRKHNPDIPNWKLADRTASSIQLIRRIAS